MISRYRRTTPNNSSYRRISSNDRRRGYRSRRSFSHPPQPASPLRKQHPHPRPTPLQPRRHLQHQPTPSRLKYRLWHHHQWTVSSPRPHLNHLLRRPRRHPHALTQRRLLRRKPQSRGDAGVVGSAQLDDLWWEWAVSQQVMGSNPSPPKWCC